MTIKHEKMSDLALQWAEVFLEERGCHLKGQFTPVSTMSWSSVHQINTSVGLIYLKQMPPSFALETKLLLSLGCAFPNKVPEIVGHNDDLSCFLMFDSGIPLRDHLKTNYQVQLVKEAFASYVSIQQGMAIDKLLSLGVPDWRLALLPSLYSELLNKAKFLKEDGLNQKEIKGLKDLMPRVHWLCKELQQYAIPETIEHSDFQDSNILLDNHGLIINDWGEAVITHPFFSLVFFFISAARIHQMNEKSDIYQELQTAYLRNWLAFEDNKRLLEALALAKRLTPIKYALSFYRITELPGWLELNQNKGRISHALQQFINDETKHIYT